MRLSGHIKEAFANILNAKLRSFLTILGVLVGTASVVALVSGGQLATSHALEQFKNLGTDLLSVNIESQQTGAPTSEEEVVELRLKDVKEILNTVPGLREAAAYTIGYGNTSYEGHRLQANIVGASRTLQRLIKIDLKAGRFVSSLDNQQFFCVVGSKLAEQIRKYSVVSPIGHQIRVNDHYFTIIGIAKPWTENMFMYANINRSVIIPVETSLLINQYTQIRNIIFRLKPHVDIGTVEEEINSEMNHIAPGKRLFFRSAKELIASMEKQRQTLTLFLALIGSISLVVGGIGVMNIMLVSVIERRREIGIRMAVGAKSLDIQLMFISEAIALTLFGGLLGIITGELISFATAFFSGWHFHFYLFPPVAGFVVSVLVGIFFGFYPSYQASKLDPIETLRSG